MKIHAALMTQNEHLDLVRNLTVVLPHVDSVTVVDGGSTDGTIPYMRNWSSREPKLRYFIHPWRDDFPAQRNNYLARVAEIASLGDWLLCFDPDEFLDVEALRLLPELTKRNIQRVGRWAFRCRSVSLRGEEVVWSNKDDYWKGLFFRWSRDLRYGHNGEGAVHEDLRGLSGITRELRGADGFPELYYEHRKQENVIWQRGVRNYFIGGGGPNLGSSNLKWVEMRAMAARRGIRTWAKMLKHLIAGDLDDDLRGWIIQHRLDQGWDGASEQREWYKFYFRMLHPEQEPPDLRGETIP